MIRTKVSYKETQFFLFSSDIAVHEKVDLGTLTTHSHLNIVIQKLSGRFN